MSVRSFTLEDRLHRLANRVECELGPMLCELLAESRVEAVHDLSWGAIRFIEACRAARDRKEGGDA